MTDSTLSQLMKLVLKFRADRDWQKFHTPKELAISLVIEACELLQIMQWRTGNELAGLLRRRRRQVADELADCLHCILLLAHDLGIDLNDAFQSKLRKTAEKYPVRKCRGKPDKYTELD